MCPYGCAPLSFPHVSTFSLIEAQTSITSIDKFRMHVRTRIHPIAEAYLVLVFCLTSKVGVSTSVTGKPSTSWTCDDDDAPPTPNNEQRTTDASRQENKHRRHKNTQAQEIHVKQRSEQHTIRQSKQSTHARTRTRRETTLQDYNRREASRETIHTQNTRGHK